MKGVTIILMGLMLVLGLGTARAATGPQVSSSVSSSVAVSANDVDPLLDDPSYSAPFSPATFLDSGTDSDEGMEASQSIPVLNYAISPQVMIDLECRPFATEENGSEFVSNIADVKQITQNFMVGFRYKF